MDRRDPGFDVWVVVADVLVGFLCVLFLVLMIRGTTGHPPPEAVQRFANEMNELKEKRGGKFDLKRQFSEVQLEYAEKLLFVTCEWNLSTDGRDLLKDHFRILLKYSVDISRIQIEGHADSRPATSCSRLQRAGLRQDNWILSSLRALEVRDFLETFVKDWARENQEEGSGASPILLKTLEAVGRGDLHPRDEANPENPINRRIEITIHFKEITSF